LKDLFGQKKFKNRENMNLLLRIIANCAAIALAAEYVSGFVFNGSPLDLFITGTVISFINSLIKPFIKLISLPLIFLTLGLFNILINVGLLLFADKLLPYLRIDGFWPAFWGVLILSIMNFIVTQFKKEN